MAFKFNPVTGQLDLVGSSTGGSSTFITLTDVPSSYSAQALKGVRVNAGETGLEFFTLGGGTGTVTSVGSADGSITVTNATTTPDLAVVKAPILSTGRTISTTGDVTYTSSSFNGSANVTGVATIANSAVTLAKQADVATSTVFYRKTAGTGAPEVQTLATLKTDLGLSGTNSGDQTITLTGEVTGSGTSSFVATLTNSAVIGKVLTGLSLVSTTVISATDTVLVALGSLQAQITALTTTVGTKVSSVGATSPITSSGGTTPTISTSMATGKLIGRGTAGTGVFEEITLGTNLSLTGTTLNAIGGGGGTTITTQDEGSTLSTTVTTLNFTGAGVTASGSGSTTTINIPGGGGGSVSLTSTEIDFGSSPVSSKTFTITDVSVSSSNKILVFKNPTTATGRVGDDWEMDMAEFSAKAGTGNFTVAVLSPYKMVGLRSIYYQII